VSHHIVAVQSLDYCYPDGRHALQCVNFTLHHGEAAAIIGANGAGKSTLLRHLIGTLAPTSGSVRIGDDPVLPSTLKQVRRTVGMVFQDADDQLFMPTVYEDVAFGPINQGLPPAEVEKRVKNALFTVGCEHLRDRPPYRLSGGEKRAVAIATVLAMSPNILVMDEPTANLDARARRHCIRLLQGFTHTRIIATHDLDLVLDVCTRVIVLHEGQIVADGSTMEIFRDKKLLDRYHLEQPLRMQGCPVCSPSSEPCQQQSASDKHSHARRP